ncbi:MAG: hypothetical protein A2Z25_07490 [Planctomycetes bacterium RBG_16_55_9]|nr:MAG: hypothetical protein A2Z25_07490 [Planctomycetes bacterium RBG_16_55_9]
MSSEQYAARTAWAGNLPNLFFWVGEKHSGKTTALARLVETARAEGFNVTGVLAPSLYRDGRLMGFDVVDLRNETRAPLARRKMDAGATWPFAFLDDGLRFGNVALSREATESADLVIVDEFGPVELSGQGWRSSVDALLVSSNAAILLVIRRELIDSVHHLYADFHGRVLDAAEPKSYREIIHILNSRCHRVGWADSLPMPSLTHHEPHGQTSCPSYERMLLIGSAGRNVGKTELACEILRKFSKSHNIVGIKVTTVADEKGCGVCSSIYGAYSIVEETNAHSRKDTARLLRAGASRVFWLRVLQERLLDGLTALLDVVGPGAVSICESNSLRYVMEPGLFLMISRPESNAWKSSARKVKDLADRIVLSQNGKFSLDLDQVRLVDGRWALLEKATAIVMAGGASQRMGTDKSMLPINGRPLIETVCGQLHGSFEQILISANDSDKFAFLGFEIVRDRIPGQGPLMGIASALAASASELNFVVACDVPHIRLTLARRMLSRAADGGADIVVPMTRDGQYEPLFAVYRKSVLGAVNEALSSGHRKISEVFSLCNVEYIELETSIPNVNTMAEYQELQEHLGG